MINQYKLRGELAGLSLFKDLITAYQEIAANNMRRIRSSVVANRDFLSEITLIYREVRSNYRQEINHILKDKKHKHKDASLVSLLPQNDKTVCVLLSTNTTLYGSIVRETYQAFRSYYEREKPEVVMVGKVGKRLFEADYPGVGFSYFDFPEGESGMDSLKQILAVIVRFEKVVVFHSKFDSIVSVRPASLVLSGDELVTDYTGDMIRYIFEPALEKIVVFFEQEIFAAIFEQVLHESDLSKFASRIVLLDKTVESIRQEERQMQIEQRRLTHQAFNKEQQNILSSMSLWRKF